MTKVCSKCGINQPLNNFYFRKDNNKYRNECKKCLIEKVDKYYILNKNTYKEKRKKYYTDNKEKFIKEANRNYFKNREKRLPQMREYRLKNIDLIREKEKIKVNKYLENPEFKFIYTLRRRINQAIKSANVNKLNCTIELLGCDVLTAKLHIESQFKDGMNWDNYGFKTWHIDHIKPIASFDLSKIEEQKKAFNYLNLQPLWAKENLSKGKKF